MNEEHLLTCSLPLYPTQDPFLQSWTIFLCCQNISLRKLSFSVTIFLSYAIGILANFRLLPLAIYKKSHFNKSGSYQIYSIFIFVNFFYIFIISQNLYNIKYIIKNVCVKKFSVNFVNYIAFIFP